MTDGSGLVQIFQLSFDNATQVATLTAYAPNDSDLNLYNVRIKSEHPTIPNIS